MAEELTAEEIKENIREILINYFDSIGDGDTHGDATDKIMFWVKEYAKKYARIKEREAAAKGWDAGYDRRNDGVNKHFGFPISAEPTKEQFLNDNYPLV